MQIFVNGALVAEDLTEIIEPCKWYQAQGNWSSGNSTTAHIEIIDNYNAFMGDDFAIDDIVFKQVTNIENSANNPIGINIGSNPVNSDLTVKLTNAASRVELMLINEQGQVVAIRTLEGVSLQKETIFEVESWASGWYVLQVKSAIGTISKKIIIQK